MKALQAHWPEYLIEAWALAMFMVSASLFTIWSEQPNMPLHRIVASPDLRRALVGVAMGATAIGLIYSPWGKRSGAHMNPAVTLAFLSLRRIAPWDALFYILAQFLGGGVGVLAVWGLFGASFADPPISFIATLPGAGGESIAFAAELSISVLTMSTILFLSSKKQFAGYTGLAAGLLIASYVTFEAPLSGFSMNPARSFASALPAGSFSTLWIYFTAPLMGMWAATRMFSLLSGAVRQARVCAKLQHSADTACIHCGHKP